MEGREQGGLLLGLWRSRPTGLGGSRPRPIIFMAVVLLGDVVASYPLGNTVIL